MSARTITLDTIDRGPVVVPEPGWCRGHEGELPEYFADITHNTRIVRAAATTDRHGTVPLLQVHISHAPYRERFPEPHPVISVVLDCKQDFVAEDIAELIEGLRSVERILAYTSVEAKRLREVQP
ncbi:hypothetical protein [Streptomyces sp. NPDC086182]|uniref:DUF6907 domain-containing protein n=1 Tax=Streptomyces sp. NPDC086182 TaxID=3155058 RepID=UPI0034328E35